MQIAITFWQVVLQMEQDVLTLHQLVQFILELWLLAVHLAKMVRLAQNRLHFVGAYHALVKLLQPAQLIINFGVSNSLINKDITVNMTQDQVAYPLQQVLVTSLYQQLEQPIVKKHKVAIH